MNKKIILFLVLLLIISFGLGAFAGYGKLIPDSILTNLELKQSTYQNIYTDFPFKRNLSTLFHINNSNDITKLRSDLLNYIWGEPYLTYSKLPTNIEKNIIDKKL